MAITIAGIADIVPGTTYEPLPDSPFFEHTRSAALTVGNLEVPLIHPVLDWINLMVSMCVQLPLAPEKHIRVHCWWVVQCGVGDSMQLVSWATPRSPTAMCLLQYLVLMESAMWLLK